MDFPFFEDLRSNIYELEKNFLKPAKTVPNKNEFKIGKGWKILLPVSASEQLQTAAQDLRDFMKAGCGLELPVQKEGAKAGKNSIILRKTKSRNFDPESYRIKCSPEGIIIEGTGDSGIMYGVFYLEELMKFRGAPLLEKGSIERKTCLKTRIFRSPMAFYYAEEIDQLDFAYPDNYLQKMAHHGFNGVWLRGILRDLVKVKPFPEFGKNSAGLMEKLNSFTQRCRKYGIKVYFYFTEPLAFGENDRFWEKHPDVKGEYYAQGKDFSMCTGSQKVKQYLKEGFHHLFKNAPDLGGVILITASEHHTHCYSHTDMRGELARAGSFFSHEKLSCPRCRKKSPADVIGEIITLINQGVKSASPEARVIAWNWSWNLYYPEPQKEVIEKIPEDVILMAGFERGGLKETDGVKHEVDEYSITYIGPSERFRGVAALAKKQKRQIYAKLQIGITHEIATVPFFPAYHNVAEKFIRLKKHGGSGAMESWNLGNILSHNTEIANYLSWTQTSEEDIDKFLLRVAERDFGSRAAKNFLKAWKIFSKSTVHFPMDIRFVYASMVNFGPAYPFFFRKVDRPMPINWLLPKEVKYNVHFASMENSDYGDRYESYCATLGLDMILKSLKLFCKDWVKGVSIMRDSLKLVPPRLKRKAEGEYAVAAAILSQFISKINFTEFTHLRDLMYAEDNKRKKKSLLSKMEKITKGEISNSRFCKTLLAREATLGFHVEAFGYLYNEKKIDRKIKMLKNIIDREIPEYVKNNI